MRFRVQGLRFRLVGRSLQRLPHLPRERGCVCVRGRERVCVREREGVCERESERGREKKRVDVCEKGVLSGNKYFSFRNAF